MFISTIITNLGRWYLNENVGAKDNFRCVAKFNLSDDVKSENYGFGDARVYRFVK